MIGGSLDSRALFFMICVVLVTCSLYGAAAAQAESGSGELLIAARGKAGGSRSVKAVDKDKPDEMIDIWLLRQTSNLVGPIKCLICPQGVRLKAEKMKLLWIFRAPDWDAFLYNLDAKCYCYFTYDQWQKRGFFMPQMTRKNANAKETMKALKLKKTGTKEKIAGCNSYKVEATYPNGVKYGELWMASDIRAPEQFSEVIGKMVSVPIEAGGTPLRAKIRQRKEISMVLDTESAVKKKVEARLFLPIGGYKKVKDEMALLFSESSVFDEGDSLFGKEESKLRRRHKRRKLDF